MFKMSNLEKNSVRKMFWDFFFVCLNFQFSKHLKKDCILIYIICMQLSMQMQFSIATVQTWNYAFTGVNAVAWV